LVSRILALQFEVVLQPEEDGGFSVSVPALPGCHTQGETHDEALAMTKDAIEGYLEVLVEEGRPLPQPALIERVTRRRVSSRLPSVRPRQLIRVLDQKGWRPARSKGSHHHFTHPDSRNIVTVAIHAKDISTARSAASPPTRASIAMNSSVC
jgi:predicted RNase H-like HicB family nuclease/predicted RNA binding protein YcfA (HicA-like mRNA interferase family)